MAIRRQTRLRKEYLYRRSLKGAEKESYEKQKKLQEAIREGKPIPTELLSIVQDLEAGLAFNDENTLKAPRTIDDEYAEVGVLHPRVLVTTSRNPSSRLTQFAKEFRLLIPNASRMNRGNHTLPELISAARGHGLTDIAVLHETRGRPDGLVISHLPYGPTAYFGLMNVVMRHDLPQSPAPMSTAFPHLIFHQFTTDLGHRVQAILSALFPVCKEKSQRVLTFANEDDFISFRHHTYTKGKDVVLEEIGPRMELKLYKIRLGTVDMDEAENEWVLSTFTNTARKRNFL